MNRCVPGIYRTYCRLTLTVGMGIALGNLEEGNYVQNSEWGEWAHGNGREWEYQVIPAHL